MCTFSPAVSVRCLYTCGSSMCAPPNHHVSSSLQCLSWLLLFLTSKKEKKQNAQWGKNALCVIVRDLVAACGAT